MKLCAVIDTNVFISALLTKNKNSSTVKVLEAIFEGKIVPLYHKEILNEYDEVLHRGKFHFKEEQIQIVLKRQGLFQVAFLMENYEQS